MNNIEINRCLLDGRINEPGVLPHVEALRNQSFVFRPDFGLNRLPEEAGLLLIRGPRQFGKSTWLEQEMEKTIRSYGPGTVMYLNGDEIKDEKDLFNQISEYLSLFPKKAPLKRLFIDEITAVKSWESPFKRLADQGLLKDILVISTGSKAVDLRRGAERLPGRKGKLARTNYLFTPISYSEFSSQCQSVFQSKTVIAYMLSGGCPIACSEMATHGKIPEYVITMVRDWMMGECVAGGRNRGSLLAVMEKIILSGGNPVGQAMLAREAGLANNTVAAGYIELLGDLLTVAPCFAWDASRRIQLRRKPGKLHFINILAALAWHPSKIRSVDDFQRLPSQEQSKFMEWFVAQELYRRQAVRGDEIPEKLSFWKSDEHEIDFVIDPHHFIEVKLGSASPVEFLWFSKIFPKARLDVISERPFGSGQVTGLAMEEFLQADFPSL